MPPAAPARAAPSLARTSLLLLLAAACFSTASPFARAAAPTHPLVIAAARTGLAALLLIALGPRAALASFAALPARRRLAVVLTGAVLAAHFGCYLGGLALTSIPAAVTLVSLEPVAVVVVAAVAFRLRPRAGEVAGIALATGGALLVAAASGRGSHRLAGDLLVLVAALLFGFYLAAARGLAAHLPARAYVTLVYASASLCLTLACLAAGVPLRVGPGALPYVVALAIVPTLGGHSLVQWASRHAPPALVALVSSGETLGSLALGALWLGELPSPLEGLGAFVVLAGVLATLASQRGRPTS
ncbi:MAG TPA: DMT family transporter [Polyangiaceae bacterium]|nr:DMT family transporter [Polyangiaceae bacterium]